MVVAVGSSTSTRAVPGGNGGETVVTDARPPAWRRVVAHTPKPVHTHST